MEELKVDLAKPRPPLFRALGKAEPPNAITVDGAPYRLVEIYKHDSWAATGTYTGPAGTIVCKFNRVQSIWLFPMAWLGRHLARREARFYRLLADVPCIATLCGPVSAEGKLLPNAVAHRLIAGRPIQPRDRLPDRFFDELELSLAEMHRRGVAYMDLHKRENIIVGADGRGYFIDFQVSFGINPRTWIAPLRWLLQLFQSGDRYHLAKHRIRNGPQSPPQFEYLVHQQRPWWLRAHRVVAEPLRQIRRKLLVRLGIRKGDGKADTEHFTEAGLRGPA